LSSFHFLRLKLKIIRERKYIDMPAINFGDKRKVTHKTACYSITPLLSRYQNKPRNFVPGL